VLEVRRGAADHGAEGHDRVVAFARGDAPDDEWQVERARHADDLDLLLAGTVAQQRVDCAADQRVDDQVVEARRDDRETKIARDEVAVQGASISRY